MMNYLMWYLSLEVLPSNGLVFWVGISCEVLTVCGQHEHDHSVLFLEI